MTYRTVQVTSAVPGEHDPNPSRTGTGGPSRLVIGRRASM